MNKIRTIMIDGIEIQTSLTGVEIAGLVQRNEELKQLVKKQKEVIDRIKEFIKELYDNTDDTTCYEIDRNRKEELLEILKEVSE